MKIGASRHTRFNVEGFLQDENVMRLLGVLMGFLLSGRSSTWWRRVFKQLSLSILGIRHGVGRETSTGMAMPQFWLYCFLVYVLECFWYITTFRLL